MSSNAGTNPEKIPYLPYTADLEINTYINFDLVYFSSL